MLARRKGRVHSFLDQPALQIVQLHLQYVRSRQTHFQPGGFLCGIGPGQGNIEVRGAVPGFDGYDGEAGPFVDFAASGVDQRIVDLLEAVEAGAPYLIGPGGTAVGGEEVEEAAVIAAHPAHGVVEEADALGVVRTRPIGMLGPAGPAVGGFDEYRRAAAAKLLDGNVAHVAGREGDLPAHAAVLLGDVLPLPRLSAVEGAQDYPGRIEIIAGSAHHNAGVCRPEVRIDQATGQGIEVLVVPGQAAIGGFVDVGRTKVAPHRIHQRIAHDGNAAASGGAGTGKVVNRKPVLAAVGGVQHDRGVGRRLAFFQNADKSIVGIKKAHGAEGHAGGIQLGFPGLAAVVGAEDLGGLLGEAVPRGDGPSGIGVDEEDVVVPLGGSCGSCLPAKLGEGGGTEECGKEKKAE